MLWIPADCISIKAKTSEGLGPVGEGRAIEAYAVAYIKK
jgi:2C-methyl-D-erythritol 2,4-cyclodiphosphate synthase